MVDQKKKTQMRTENRR